MLGIRDLLTVDDMTVEQGALCRIDPLPEKWSAVKIKKTEAQIGYEAAQVGRV